MSSGRIDWVKSSRPFAIFSAWSGARSLEGCSAGAAIVTVIKITYAIAIRRIALSRWGVKLLVRYQQFTRSGGDGKRYGFRFGP